MDYILVDPFVVLPDAQLHYSEKLYYLPDCYQVNDRQRPISTERMERSDYGLPDDGAVFCSFNQTYKITPEIFGVWMDALKSVDASVLWLWQSNQKAMQNLYQTHP